MFRIAICDESQEFAEELAKIFEELSGEIGITVGCDIFRKPSAVGKAVMEHCYRLVIFTLIHGRPAPLDIAGQMREAGFSGEIIFAADTVEYAYPAYSVYPLTYLLFPLSKKILRAPFRRLCEKIDCRPRIVLRSHDNGKISVYTDEIMYIEVLRNDIYLHCFGETYQCAGPLADVCTMLPSVQFYRTHRSFTVNLDQVLSMERYQFIMRNGDKVTIAKNRYPEAREAFDTFSGKKRNAGAPDEAFAADSGDESADEGNKI